MVFEQCSFQDLVIENCYFQELVFHNIKNIGNIFSINGCTFHYFKIDGTDILNNTITFHHSEVIKEFTLKNIKIGKGGLNLRKNTFPLQDNNFSHLTMILNCQLYNCDIYENNFGADLLFSNNKLTDEIKANHSQNIFKKCTFEKASFANTDFGEICKFTNCIFTGTTIFEKIKNISTTELSFIECNFKKTTSFNKAEIYNFSLHTTSFEDIVSLQDTNFYLLRIDRIIFEKNALFDNIKINDLDNCSRRTIRTIKQQLQNISNTIDYNRFRSYELSVYYKELTWGNNFKDKFILWATKWVTGFDHSWSRAFWFTIISGLIIYSLLYFCEYHGSYNYEELNNYFTGAFRFFLITDFSSPFKDKGEYLQNAWLWIPLIFGKIVMAFGIYEMIQAFRKFKS